MTTRTELLTADEFLAERPAAPRELTDGRIVRRPALDARAGWVVGQLAGRLFSYAEPRELGLVLVGSAFVVGRDPDSVRVADVAVVRGVREPTEVDASTAPDLVVEVASPDAEHRAAGWRTAGVSAVWIVDPVARTVRVHGAEGPPRVLAGEDALETDSLPGFACRVSALFEA